MNVLTVQDNPPKEWQKYDLCLILPTEEDTCKIRSDALMIIRTMAKILGRKYLYIYYSDDGMRVYVLIRAGLKILRAKAHSEKWKLLLDEHACQQAASEGSEGEFITAFSVPHNPKVSSLRPFEYLYAEYNAEEEVESLYQCSRHSKHPFHKALRIKMLFDFFEKNSSTDQSLSLEKLRDSGTITEMFAIHYLRERDQIAQHMFGWKPQPVPEDLLQHYFGEQITMYFSFLDHMFFWQLLPAVVGVAFQATAITFDNYSRPEIPAFAFFLIFWNITAVQTWSKKQYMLGLKWNMLGSDFATRLRDHIRYQFHGTHIKSPIDGKEMLFSPKSRHWQYFFMSGAIFVLSVIGALIAAAAIYYYARPRISRTIVAPYEQWVISGGTALQIMVCNWLYYYIAVRSTEWENHRIEKDFVNSLSVKLAGFQIVNTLATSMYLAFAARFVSMRQRRINSLGDCGYDNCVFPVTINVVTIAAVRALIHVFGKFLLPYLRYWILYTFFQGYQDRVISQQEAVGDMTVVTVTGDDNQLGGNSEDRAAAPEMDAIYRRSGDGMTSHHDDVESMGSNNGMLLGGGNRGHKDTDRFSGISPLRNNDGGNKNTTTRQAEPAATGIFRSFQGSNSKNTSQKQSSGKKDPPAVDHEEEDNDDDFDEEDDLASDLSDDVEQPFPNQHQHNNASKQNPRRSVRPDMTRTMSRYMQYRQRQELEESAARNNNAHALVREDEDGDGHDSEDENEIAIDPFKSYVYHSYDHVQQFVTWYNDLLGVLILAWCFGAMLPGIFALVFVWLAVETRGQAWLLLYLFPRPVPKAAENIEPWLLILDGCLTIGILTNASLITFTMSQFSDWSLGYKCALWIGIVLSLMGYNSILRYFYSELPEEIVIQKRRNAFIEEKLVKRHPDVEDTLPLDML